MARDGTPTIRLATPDSRPADAPGATSCGSCRSTSAGGGPGRSPAPGCRTIHRARAAAARSWLHAQTTSGNSPSHGMILAVFDRAVHIPRMRLAGKDQRLPRRRLTGGEGCPGGLCRSETFAALPKPNLLRLNIIRAPYVPEPQSCAHDTARTRPANSMEHLVHQDVS